MRLSLALRLLALAVAGVLLLSGAAWLMIGWAGPAEPHLPGTGSGTDANAWRPFLLQLHGAGAFAALLLLGALVPLHVVPAWKSRRNRASGVGILLTMGVLVVSAYALYYCGDERWRAALSGLHSWLGLASPFAIAGHLWLGRRSRP